MTVLGLDLYAGNGDIDLVKARDEDGVRFVILKATEGRTFPNPAGTVTERQAFAWFDHMWQKVLDAGLIPGSYHFARQGNNGAADEAAHYLARLGGRKGLMGLDLEDQRDGLSLPQRAAWSAVFLDTIHAATAIAPFAYTYGSWWRSAPFAPVRAHYPGWIPLDQVGADPLVQSTHMIGTLGTLDVDTFAGTVDELRTLTGLAGVPISVPTPTPALPSHLEATVFELVRNTVTDEIVAWSAGGAWWHVPNTDWAKTALASTLCAGQRDVAQAEFDLLATIAASARGAA